jgi:hypothetical protein
VGFEPTRVVSPAGFQDRCLQPLGHPSGKLTPSLFAPLARHEVDELYVHDLVSPLLSPIGAATTSSEDRKELLRKVVKSVIVDERTPDAIRARIVGANGAEDERIDARLSRYAHPFIRE